MEKIQKLIAMAGITSRRKAEILIAQQKVKVNGKIVTLGDRATFNDEIIVDGTLVKYQDNYVYYVINKPQQVITSLHDPHKRVVITDLIKEQRRIFPVGRLDYNTTGVLLLTNDGELTHRLTHPSYEISRVYQVIITRSLNEEELAFLNSDQVIINKQKSLQQVSKIKPKTYQVTLHVGTYHHVKKLFALVKAPVVALKRINYGSITLKDLALGQYRPLTLQEIRRLKKMVKMI